MSLKNALTIVAILLLAVLAVGLVICRPMAAENYASGVFHFDAVDEIYVRAWESGPDAEQTWLLLTAKDPGFDELIELIDGKGFGRTPDSLFSEPDASPSDGDRCWEIRFHCSVSDSRLELRHTGGVLQFAGDQTLTVTTQHKSTWAQEVYDLILPLYPAPAEGEE